MKQVIGVCDKCNGYVVADIIVECHDYRGNPDKVYCFESPKCFKCKKTANKDWKFKLPTIEME